MAIIKLKCIGCGQNIEFDDSIETVFCMYCGRQVTDAERASANTVANETKDDGKVKMTVFYTKPFWGQSPLVIAILDDAIELQLKNRVPITIKVTPGKHKLTVRPMKLMSFKEIKGMDFELDVTPDSEFEVKFIGTSDRSTVTKR